MTKKRFSRFWFQCISSIFATIILLCASGTHLTADEGPSKEEASNVTAVQVVDRLHEALIKAMKMGDKSSCQERFQLLAPVIQKSFDFETISRIVLGRRHWRSLDEQTRDKFVKAFAQMTVATYAQRFKDYSGEKFETAEAKLDPRGYCLVKAFLIKKDGEKIDFEYICKKVNGGWKIVSVSARGVNDLSLKRADYNNFLKKHTVEDLIKLLEAQAGRCLNQ